MELLIVFYIIGFLLVALGGILIKLNLKYIWSFWDWVKYVVVCSLSWLTIIMLIFTILYIIIGINEDNLDNEYYD